MNVRSIFTPPVFEDPEKSRVARLLYSICWAVVLIVALLTIMGTILLPSYIVRWLSMFVGATVANAFCLALTYRGYTRVASYSFVLQFWLLVTTLAATGGGTSSPSASGYLFIVLSAGLLLGVRAGILTAIICAGTEMAIAYAEVSGLLPHSIIYHTTSSLLLTHMFFSSLVVVFVYLYARGIQTAFQQANRELTERRRVEFENQKTVHDLGERVKELTAVHMTAHILQREEPDLQKLLNDLAKLLPPAFQYPEVTAGRVRLGEQEAATPGFTDSAPILRSAFTTADGKQGAIEVVYTEERPPAHEGPFLHEERSLLITLADMLRNAYDQRSATAGMRASEAQLRFYANATFEGIGVSVDGCLVEANEQFARMLGYTVAEMIGKPVEIFAAPESRELIMRQVKEQRVEPYEAVGLRKDGSRFLAEVRGKPTIHNGRSGRVTVIRDITERKRIEEQIKESEARYRNLIESIRDAIYTVSTDGSITSLNPAFEAILGWTRADWVGKKFSDLIHPADLPKALEMFARVLTGEAVSQTELRVRNKSGTFVTGEFVSVPQTKNGHVIGVLGVARDITERKQMEEQLRRSQRLDSLGALAGGVAHDLNNVLAPILLSVEVLQRRIPNPNLKKMIDSLGKSAHRGKEIVKQVLTFARGSGHDFAPQNVRYLIREIESFIKNAFPKNIAVQVKIPNNTHSVIGDSTQLHQILLNLCVNARDAMPKGGKLVIAVENIQLEPSDAKALALTKPGDYVRMTVSDSGTGIPAEIREKIFEPFFTTKEIGKGTGLGLSTVHSIVRDHQGALKLVSEVGKGTEFQIFLPALGSDAAATVEEKEKFLPNGNGECILVVDDELSVLHITRETLEAYGYTVLTAVDGAEALTILAGQQKGSVALVLTNMYMPRVDGIETINLLRGFDPDIKIVITSGLLEQIPPQEISRLRVQGYLTKPYSSEHLLTTIYTILRKAEVRSQRSEV